jgi:hypothetical protein
METKEQAAQGANYWSREKMLSQQEAHKAGTLGGFLSAFNMPSDL